MANVTNRIKMLRETAGLSQFGLGKILDVHPATISNYETGKREPELSTLIKMAEYFNVTLDFLTGRDEMPNPGQAPEEVAVMFRAVDWSKLSPEDKAIVIAVIKSVTDKYRGK